MLLQQLHAALAGDAGQDGAGQLRGDDGVPDLEHDVHRADFLDVFALHAVQPEHLGIALELGLVAGAVAGGVVAAALGVAGAAADGADVLGLDHDLDRVQPFLIVAAHGGEDHAVQGLLQGVEA